MGLTTEGYSPKAIRLGVYAAGHDSFAQASQTLKELVGLSISPAHLQRLTSRVGTEWAEKRDQEVQAFRDKALPVGSASQARAASVMLDGGRLQLRDDGPGDGEAKGDSSWREFKACSLETWHSQVRAEDPQPSPPSRFLDQKQVSRLAAELKAKRAGGPAPAVGARRPRRKRRKKGCSSRPRKLVRTVLASLASSEAFGWQVAAEVHRRGLDRAASKACVCDGQKYNWSIWEMHLQPLGFLAVLDFVHLLVYLYAAAQAASGRGSEAAWALYQGWLHLAWAGEVAALLRGMRAEGERLGQPPAGVLEDDPRRVVWEAIGYVGNNRKRMDYPRYRRLGLPTSSATVESTIKRLNRRVKGTEKFWKEGGGEAILQVRAAYLSEDGRVNRYWAQPRPRGRAVGSGRLRPRS